MSAENEEAMSFGDVAESYDRVRPGPAPAALDWLVPDGCTTAVDLAARTGLFTRALLGRVAHVTAVEPDPRSSCLPPGTGSTCRGRLGVIWTSRDRDPTTR